MKTTFEQRQRWKEKRRMGGWRDLLAAFHRKTRRSRRTLEVGERFLAELQNHPCLSEIQNAIRRAS